MCKIGKAGDQLIMLTPSFQTSQKGIYAIGGAVSPAYIEIQAEGTFKSAALQLILYGRARRVHRRLRRAQPSCGPGRAATEPKPRSDFHSAQWQAPSVPHRCLRYRLKKLRLK
ncbi:MAG: hypothetical protein U5R30_20830 [Deltaproteobacteria bacterium]|nr:hypothetical protein [Deltaproteobacteria bacterium]